MTARDAAQSPGRLTRRELRLIRSHLVAERDRTQSPYAYMFARDGEGKLVELRLEGRRFARTPVDRRGVPTGKARPVLPVHPAAFAGVIPPLVAALQLLLG